MVGSEEEAGSGEGEFLGKGDEESTRPMLDCKGTALQAGAWGALMGWREQKSKKPLHIDPAVMAWQREFMWPLNI